MSRGWGASCAGRPARWIGAAPVAVCYIVDLRLVGQCREGAVAQDVVDLVGGEVDWGDGALLAAELRAGVLQGTVDQADFGRIGRGQVRDDHTDVALNRQGVGLEPACIADCFQRAQFPLESTMTCRTPRRTRGSGHEPELGDLHQRADLVRIRPLDDAALGDDAVDQRGRGDVKDRVLRVGAFRAEAGAGAGEDFRGGALLRSVKDSPVQTIGMRNEQRATSSRPRVLATCLWGWIQTFLVDDQTALGIPSLTCSSTCHCRVRVDGHRVSPRPSSSRAATMALAASDGVLHTRRWPRATERRPPEEHRTPPPPWRPRPRTGPPRGSRSCW